jgi:hypothetical protein
MKPRELKIREKTKGEKEGGGGGMKGNKKAK